MSGRAGQRARKRAQRSKFTYPRGTPMDAHEFCRRLIVALNSGSIVKMELTAMGIEEIDGVAYEFTDTRTLIERR